MPAYAAAAVLATLAVIAYELRVARTGIFRDRRYQLTMAICLFFMIWVNGWFTKLSAPIVLYSPEAKTPWRFPWDIPVEDYLFGFALLTWVLVRWRQADERDARRARVERVLDGGRNGRGLYGLGVVGDPLRPWRAR